MNGVDELKIKQMKRYRILVFIAVVATGFLTQFHRASSGAIRMDLEQDFMMTATQFATFSSMYFYPYMLMQLPIGMLADKIGVRKIIICGCALSTIGTLIFCTAPSFAVLCLGRMLVGIGVSAPIICKEKIFVEWYAPNKIVTMGGLSSFFQNFGGVVAQGPLVALVGIFSWRTTFLGLVGLNFLVFIFVLLVIRDKPADKGFPAEIDLLGYERKVKKQKTGIVRGIWNVIKNKYTWPLLFIMPVEMGAYTMFSSTWGVSYFKDVYGYTASQASTCTTLLMIGWCVSMIFVTNISDRIKSRKKPIILLCGFSCFIWTVLVFGSNLISQLQIVEVVAALFGITGCLTALLFAEAREVNDPDSVGVTLGFLNMIGMGTGAVFPIICGSIIDRLEPAGVTGGMLYRNAFMFLFILLIIAFAASFFLIETKCQNINLIRKEKPNL